MSSPSCKMGPFLSIIVVFHFHLWNSTNKGFGFNKILIVTKQMKYLNQKNLNNVFKYASVLIAAVRALHHQIIGGLVLLLVGPRGLRYLHVCHHPHPYIRCDSTLQRVSTQSNWKFNKNNFLYFINWNWYI